MDERLSWLDEDFEVHDFEPAGWKDVAGVYIVMKYHPSQDTWDFLYVGKTRSFAERLHRNHHEWAAATQLGATHIHAKVVLKAKDRTRLERALIEEYDPELNG